MVKSLKVPEVIDIISKMWATTNDIQRLGCIGAGEALKVKRELRDKMKDQGKAVPRYLVDMTYVMDYFSISKKNLLERMEIIEMLGGVTNGK